MIVGKCPTITAGHERAQSQREPAAEPVSANGAAATGTALMSLEMEKFSPVAAPRPGRPDAFFVAHLIATAQQVPQTRNHRRASTADAMSHYHTMTQVASSGGTATRSRISRTV